jgi:hypothetical protein
MIAENLESEKTLITKTSLAQNGADRCCQLWQEVSRISPLLVSTTCSSILNPKESPENSAVIEAKPIGLPLR